MNSRDAAFDEKIKEIIEATAAEAAAAHDSKSVTSNRNTNGYIEPEDILEPGPSSRKKRKRIEDDALVDFILIAKLLPNIIRHASVFRRNERDQHRVHLITPWDRLPDGMKLQSIAVLVKQYQPQPQKPLDATSAYADRPSMSLLF